MLPLLMCAICPLSVRLSVRLRAPEAQVEMCLQQQSTVVVTNDMLSLRGMLRGGICCFSSRPFASDSLGDTRAG